MPIALLLRFGSDAPLRKFVKAALTNSLRYALPGPGWRRETPSCAKNVGVNEVAVVIVGYNHRKLHRVSLCARAISMTRSMSTLFC
jgi:hypothetical protein